MLKTIDLFAGAGGLSLGFKQTGHFRLVAAAEIKEYARETYRHNIPDPGEEFVFIENVVGYDFKSLSRRFDGIDVVIGGPPCQGFSNANRQKTNLISMNNALVKEYFRAIKEIKPRAFVMENVSMLKSSIHRFYDSYIDHDLIKKLNETSADPAKPLIPMREDKIVMSSRNHDGFDLKAIAENREQLDALLIPYALFQLLNVLNKNKNNDKRLPTYLQKHTREMCREIDDYCASDADTAEKETIHRWLQVVKNVLLENGNIKETPELQDIIELQKTFQTNTIKSVEVTISKPKAPSGTHASEGKDAEADDDKGEETESDEGSGSGHNGGSGGGNHSGDGDGRGDGKGPHKESKKKTLVGIVPLKARVVCLNKDRGEYSVTFVPSVSADNGHIELFMSAETQNYTAPIVQAVGIGQSGIEIENNKIKNVVFTEKKPVRLKVTIAYHDYCSMEVKAYGNKI